MFPPTPRIYSILLAMLVSWGIGFLSSTAHAGCARERLGFHEIDVTALSGMSKAQLILLPKSYWSYESGVVRASFTSPTRTCNGPECAPRIPLERGFTAVPVNNISVGQMFVCCTASTLRFDFDIGSHKIELSQSVEIHNPFILERPPRV